ncbi:MAG: GIY-YIG nuclease family protein [Vulcanimicrobiaceae bacterium]
METFWVYMLLCADASYYIGVTSDVDRRAAEHQQGADHRCYTFLHRPVKLVYAAEFASPDDAIRWEKQIKGWSRKKKEALTRGDWQRIRDLARKHEPSINSGIVRHAHDDEDAFRMTGRVCHRQARASFDTLAMTKMRLQ